jgi:ectoine hydroxylase-related dioxygenase (phytanoyl-CoA dioxygenase family)
MPYDNNSWLDHRLWLDLDDPDIAGYVARVGDEEGFDLRKALELWHSDGVVIFEQVVDKRLIDAFTSDVEYLRRHHRDFDLFVEQSGKQGHIRDLLDADLESPGLKFNSIHTISYAAACLSLTREVAVFLKHVFGGPPCALQSLTFYKGSQQPIHIDYPYVRCQDPLTHLAASWIPLEDIQLDSGPLAYYPGSHRDSVSGFFDWGGGSILLEPDSTREAMDLSRYLHERMKLANIQQKIFCPRKGDALVWHGNLSHEGTVIRNEAITRKSYVTHYSSLAAYPRAHLKPSAPEQGFIRQANGGYVFEYSWQDQVKQLPSIFLKQD